VIADAAVLTRVLATVAADALRHSPPDRPPQLVAGTADGHLVIRVTDGAADPERLRGRTDSLPQRLSRDLTESMGGTVRVTATGSAFAVHLTLPTARRH
jgi:two-component system sensor histidine kinase KdpD